MSSDKARRLNLLARLAAFKTQSNLVDLQTSQQVLQKQQSACLQLQSYQHEYLNKHLLDAAKKKPINVSVLQNKSRFMADLNYAVNIQQQQLKTAEAIESASRSAWSDSYAKEQRWQELESSASHDENLKQSKKNDQENLDIWSTRYLSENANKL